MASANHCQNIYFVLLFILGVWASPALARLLSELSISDRYEEWLDRYIQMYKDVSEKERRFQIFKKKLEHIESHNAAMVKKYRLGVNEFADLTNDEFKALRNGYKNISAVSSSMDWRQKGAVNPIKDQGQCEQELVDCDTNGEDQGCEGGLMDNAFTFIKQNHGLTTEANYPYKGVDGTCNSNKAASDAAKITGYKDVPANNEDALSSAVANQPVSVAIDAGEPDFQFYLSGVFTGECGTQLDHGVTAVGYGVGGDGTSYWLVKNSWGSSWGENGYVRMLSCREMLLPKKVSVVLPCKPHTQLLEVKNEMM